MEPRGGIATRWTHSWPQISIGKMNAPTIIVEIAKIAQGLIGTLIGGALVLLGGWLADRRKNLSEAASRERLTNAHLTGMFAVRNFIVSRLNEWEADRSLAHLGALRTAQAYVHRLVDRAPGDSESLMIAFFEMGLAVDALISVLDEALKLDAAPSSATGAAVERQVLSVLSSIEQYDVISGRDLSFLTDEDLENIPGFRKPPDTADSSSRVGTNFSAPPI